MGTSLVAQWLRICLPMQETRVWSLVREDITCHRATKHVCHSYWACGLEPGNLSSWASMPWSLSSTREVTEMISPPATMKSSPSSPQLEKSPCSNKDPAETRIRVHIDLLCIHPMSLQDPEPMPSIPPPHPKLTEDLLSPEKSDLNSYWARYASFP